jgi:uncharacterized protein YdhG (YjbR/CyaY superfamily)
MQYSAATPDEYIDQLPEERKDVIRSLRSIIQDNLPHGFQEMISYGLIGDLCRKITPEEYIRVYAALR